MEDIISLAFADVIRPFENTDLIKNIFQDDYRPNKVMSVMTDGKQVSFEVNSEINSEIDFIILEINATLLLEFEVSMRCFSAEIQMRSNEQYLAKICEFVNKIKFPYDSRRVRFLITNMNKLEFPQKENSIRTLIMENLGSYPIYPGDIYFEYEYKRLIADIFLIYQSQK